MVNIDVFFFLLLLLMVMLLKYLVKVRWPRDAVQMNYLLFVTLLKLLLESKDEVIISFVEPHLNTNEAIKLC